MMAGGKLIARVVLVVTGVGSLGTVGAAAAPAAGSAAGAIPVRIVRDGDQYQLLRGGVPYRVKGAGVEFGSIESLAAHGGNSLRTWRTDNGVATGREILDEAARNGVTVAMCIEIGRERHGFDYDDAEAVADQLEYARGEVRKYKDHPALLAWIIGNELNLNSTDPKVFDAVNEISEMIHEVDGRHPTTTALAGFSGELAKLVANRAPDLDFISIQMYGDLVNLPRYLADAGYDKPYFVTEWGAIGHWEVARTAWGAPIEHSSSEKAANYLQSYRLALAPDTQHMLGSYVFLWGQKQERTPTWYGMFLADGSETETVDVMHYVWNGRWPANRAPRVERMTFDSKTARENVVVTAGEKYLAQVVASDPEGDGLHYRWEIMHESDATEEGGDMEEMPDEVHVPIENADTANPVIATPAETGAYRLFVYVYDGKGHAAHANIPFLVD